MNEIYTVKDFCKKYESLKSEQAKETLVKSVMNGSYVPYEKKITICEKIIENTYYTKDANEVKKMHINSPAQYMLYCLWLVKEYTYIIIDFSSSLEEFNLLNKTGLLDIIVSCISEREIKEFRMILDMVGNDTMQNECEIHSFIRNQVDRFGILFKTIANHIIVELSTAINNMDEKTIDKMVNKLNGLKDKFNIVK